MKSLDIFDSKLFFFIETSLREARKRIYSFLGLALSIIDLKMIPGELLDPSDLARAQTLRIYKPTEGIMIG